jgi:hypothetical protein
MCFLESRTFTLPPNQKLTRIEIERVRLMPKELREGVLYVSEEFGTAAHLCACGCGNKVRTPLGPTEWSLRITEEGPSLHPSIGNWQLPCRSHYWITGGRIMWAAAWTEQQVVAGRRAEDERRRAYYANLDRTKAGFWKRLWTKLRNFFWWKT